jgi:3-oxoacyl-[acyl-carrier protein] reductase
VDNVVVTGASRGIGLAIAQALAAAGYGVIAVARGPSAELEAAIEAARASAGALRFLAFDLAAIEAIPEFALALRRECGAIYGLVNNAGIGTSGPLATMPTADIEALLRLNTLSPIVLTRHVMRGMIAAGRGRIVNLSSVVAETGYSGLSVYGASKAALLGFTRSLAREVGPYGITVNALAPGFVDTAMTGELDPARRRRIAGRSALRRFAEAGDVAAMAVHLIGESGRNITGAVMKIDAGAA